MKSFLLLMLCFTVNTFAQTLHVNQNHPQASDAGNGSEATPFKTISAAAAIAQAGDTVLVYAGVYREQVMPVNEGTDGNSIVFIAKDGDDVIIKGSDIFKPEWNQLTGSIYEAELSDTNFSAYNPFRVLLARVKNIVGREVGDTLTLGQVFVNGIHFTEMAYTDEVDASPESWHYDWSTRKLKVNFGTITVPNEAMVEITTRERIFVGAKRGMGYIHVEGFTMEHCGNQFPSGFWANAATAQAGALGTHSGHHWIIRNNTIRWAKNLGMDIASETDEVLNGEPVPPIANVGYHLVEKNVITDCGGGGIAGFKSYENVIRNNRIERVNYLNHTAPETGGMKFHYVFNAIIEGNIFIDNYTKAIWLDNQYKGTRITKNIIINSMEMGIFIEMGFGPVLIDNNIIAYTKKGNYAPDPKGDGFYAHDASGITFAHNLVFGGEEFAAYSRIVTNRNVDGKRVQVSDIKLYNNIFMDNASGNIMMPYPGTRSKNNDANGNLYDPEGDFIVSTYGDNHTYDGKTRLPHMKFALLQNCGEDAEITEWTDRENRTQWNDQQYGLVLTPEYWQCMMNYGIESYASDITNLTLDKETLQLDFEVAQSPWNTHCIVVDGVETDFFGYPLSENPLPGPFQGLFPGALSFDFQTNAVVDSFTISTDAIEGGNVTVTPLKDKYAKGESVNVSAQANPGYRFTGWSGDLDFDSANVVFGMYKNILLSPVFELVTGVTSVTLPEVLIYPNPANERILIHSSRQVKRLRIFNSVGILQMDIRMNEAVDSDLSVDVSALSYGLYVVELTDNSTEWVRKIICIKK